jgi:hypothetical protein
MGEFYAGISSILSIGATTREASRSKDKGQAARNKDKGQASGSKKINSVDISSNVYY